ncbi:MAG: type III pantothenate kinase, partial [Flavobacteriales bacterium]
MERNTNDTMSQACILDFGNTRVKWARFVDGEFAGVQQDEEAWESLQDWSEDARWLIAASGPMDDRWTAWVETLKAKRPDSVVHLESAEGIPFPSAYHSMHTLGLDRIANAAGAAAEDAQADWLIIDAGTCITADLLQGGKFCGGSIAPGIDLRLRAM